MNESFWDYLNGRHPANKTLPKEIPEYMIVKETGWTLEYVRGLSQRDYQVFSSLSSIYAVWERNQTK